MRNKGWISLYRSLQDHPFWKEQRSFSKAEAWIDILMMANHSDNKFLLGSEFLEVERGSFITSEIKLKSKWNWSKTKVRNYLSLLESDNMITKKADSKKTTIRVVRYCDFQDFETTEKPIEDQEKTAKKPIEDFKRTSKELQKNTNNNDNNYNNEKNDKELNKTLMSEVKTSDLEDDDLLYYKIAETFRNLFIKNLSEKNASTSNQEKAKFKSYVDPIRLSFTSDKRTKEQFRIVFEFLGSLEGEFWKSNILSTSKLREQMDKLIMKANEKKPNKSFEFDAIKVMNSEAAKTFKFSDIKS